MTWRQQAGNFDNPINPEYEQEARLVDQARAGSERAFSALLARYQQPVFRLIFYLVGDADEARELSRIALKHALTRMPRVPAGFSVRPWLLRVATLVALDAVRERSESPQALIASLQLPPAPQPTARIIDSDPTLSETMELSITKLEKNPEFEVADAWDRLPIDVERELVRRLLASLPENDAELLALGVVGQVPTRDLAAISGTSQRSIRRRIARALILFQSRYQLVRQDTLPPPPPTKELDPGNTSAIMAINVARRGLNEASERMRRSWHNVRASLGTVEAQESLQTLRDGDVRTATQSRPLTAPAPSASPSTKSALPAERTVPTLPAVAAKPPRPPEMPAATSTVPVPPLPASERRSESALPVGDMSSAHAETAATIEDLAIAMQGKSDTAPVAYATEVLADTGTVAATASEQHERADEPTQIMATHDDATTIPVADALVSADTRIITHNEHADAAPEQQPTAVRQLPRFGPPAEVAAFAAEVVLANDTPPADEAFTFEEERRPDEELVATTAEDEVRNDNHAILMPPASSGTDEDVSLYSGNDEAMTFADVIAAPTASDMDVVASATNVAADDTATVIEPTNEVVVLPEVSVAEETAVTTTDVAIFTPVVAANANVENVDEVAEPLFDVTTDAEPNATLTTIDDDTLAATTQAGEDEAVADALIPFAIVATANDAAVLPEDEAVIMSVTTATDLAESSRDDTKDATVEPMEVAVVILPLVAVSDDEAPSASPQATAAEDVAIVEATPTPPDNMVHEAPVADEIAIATLTDNVSHTTAAEMAPGEVAEPAIEIAADEVVEPATEMAPDDVVGPTTTADVTFTEVALPAAAMTMEDAPLIADKPTAADAVAPTQEQDDATSASAQDAEPPPQDVVAGAGPTAEVVPPYIALQEERTMPVSRHFGDTVVVRDGARYEYVARHQGQSADLSDLSGITGAAFSEQDEEPEEMPAPARPPAAGVLHIVPESVSPDGGRFAALTSSDLDTTIVAKPIAQPAREEVTALTQPADLADLVGILSQMTQLRQQPSGDMPTSSPATMPRRLTRPMPRLDRDAPEPPNEEP